MRWTTALDVLWVCAAVLTLFGCGQPAADVQALDQAAPAEDFRPPDFAFPHEEARLWISRPAPGEQLDGPTIRVEGRLQGVEGAVTVWIGDREAEFLPDGRFVGAIEPRHGLNKLQVRAVLHDQGRELVVRRDVVWGQRWASIDAHLVVLHVGQSVWGDGEAFEADPSAYDVAHENFGSLMGDMLARRPFDVPLDDVLDQPRGLHLDEVSVDVGSPRVFVHANDADLGFVALLDDILLTISGHDLSGATHLPSIDGVAQASLEVTARIEVDLHQGEAVFEVKEPDIVVHRLRFEGEEAGVRRFEQGELRDVLVDVVREHIGNVILERCVDQMASFGASVGIAGGELGWFDAPEAAYGAQLRAATVREGALVTAFEVDSAPWAAEPLPIPLMTAVLEPESAPEGGLQASVSLNALTDLAVRQWDAGILSQSMATASMGEGLALHPGLLPVVNLADDGQMGPGLTLELGQIEVILDDLAPDAQDLGATMVFRGQVTWVNNRLAFILAPEPRVEVWHRRAGEQDLVWLERAEQVETVLSTVVGPRMAIDWNRRLLWGPGQDGLSGLGDGIEDIEAAVLDIVPQPGGGQGHGWAWVRADPLVTLFR